MRAAAVCLLLMFPPGMPGSAPVSGREGVGPHTPGWEHQVSGTSETLLGVSFIDVNTGWAVGDFGSLLHTTDGGATWTRQRTDLFATDVVFLDERTGVAVGGGFAAYTRDGGETWKRGHVPVSASFLGLDMVNANEGWASGTGGTIIHTIDGGLTWTAQETGTTMLLTRIDFADRLNGWAVGGWSDNAGHGLGVILHTDDGGSTWVNQTVNTGTDMLWGVSTVDASTAWVGGISDTLLHTTDGGMTWVSQGLGRMADIAAVKFLDRNEGWVAGEPGIIYHTDDGGSTWVKQNENLNNNTEDGTDIAFVDRLNGWVVAHGGGILHTNDGGGGDGSIPPPRISRTVPSDGEGNVSPDAPVIIEFTKEMEPGSFEFSVTPDPGGWAASWDAGMRTVTLTHYPFDKGVGYSAHVTRAEDRQGQGLAAGGAPNPFRFTTISSSPPERLEVTPGNASIRVNESLVVEAYLYLRTGVDVTNATLFDWSLEPLSIGEVVGLSGNSVSVRGLSPGEGVLEVHATYSGWLLNASMRLTVLEGISPLPRPVFVSPVEGEVVHTTEVRAEVRLVPEEGFQGGRVQMRMDMGGWVDAVRFAPFRWEYMWTGVAGGAHTLWSRACMGSRCSAPSSVNISVEESGGGDLKGFHLETPLWVMVIVAAVALLAGAAYWRRRRRRYPYIPGTW